MQKPLYKTIDIIYCITVPIFILYIILSTSTVNLANGQIQTSDYLRRITRNIPSDDPEKEARILTGLPIRKRRAQTLDIRTSLGIAVGTIDSSESTSQDQNGAGRKYFSFRGIPFARPPIGSMRWSDPRDANEAWPSGRLDATRFKPFCPQYDHEKKSVIGNEDCLYLNVFTPFLPDSSTATGLPVLVFIHGGAYIRGASSTHGPDKLMRENIVVVTLNYRLGVFGFLSTSDSDLPGNYGALDQISALRWVRRFIKEFGGDPGAVTLGGFSAGASFVHLHVLSPLSRGLFQKAIIMSGAGNCLWSVQNEPLEVAEELAKDLGCSTSSSSKLKECLLLKGTNELIEAQTKKYRYIYWPFLYRPVIDGSTRADPFLPEAVKELEQRPLPASVPVLIGGVPEEGILFALTVLLFSEDSSSPSSVFDSSTKYLFESVWPNETTSKEISSNLASFYFSKSAKEDVNTLVAELTEATTDLLFTSCLWKTADNLAQRKSPVYTYLMTHHDPGSPSFAAAMYPAARAVGITSPLLSHGVSHGDDLILLFRFPFGLGEISQRDHRMSQMLTRFWANFVRTGAPQSQEIFPSSRVPPWKSLEPGRPNFYYQLSLSPSVIERPFKYQEQNFWTQTLPLMEKNIHNASISYSWQVATWILMTIIILLILSVIGGLLFFRRKRKMKSYSGGVPTLRSQLPRLSAVGES